MSTAANLSNPPKRRWYQYSLRTLLLFTTICVVASGWLSLRLQRARAQKEAVERIENLNGRVFYDWQGKSSEDPDPRLAICAGLSLYCDRLHESEKRPQSSWLRTNLGNDFFDDVVEVLFCSGRKINSVNLKCIESLTQLKALVLIATEIDETGLEHLEGLTQLEVLYLSDTKVTDAGLEHLKGLTRLKKLDLSDTNITDAGLKHLVGLSQLEWLELYDDGVTDAGVELLARRIAQLPDSPQQTIEKRNHQRFE